MRKTKIVCDGCGNVIYDSDNKATPFDMIFKAIAASSGKPETYKDFPGYTEMHVMVNDEDASDTDIKHFCMVCFDKMCKALDEKKPEGENSNETDHD